MSYLILNGRTLTKEQQSKAKYMGAYREPRSKNQSLPIMKHNGLYFDLLGHQVDMSKLIKIAD